MVNLWLKVLFVAFDTIGLFGAWHIGGAASGKGFIHWLNFFAFLSPFVMLNYLFEQYDPSHISRKLIDLINLWRAIFIALVFNIILLYIFNYIDLSGYSIVYISMIYASYSTLWRYLYGYFIFNKVDKIYIIYIGDDDISDELKSSIFRHHGMSLINEFVSPIFDNEECRELSSFVNGFVYENKHSSGRVVIVSNLDISEYSTVFKCLIDLRMKGFGVYNVKSFCEHYLEKYVIRSIRNEWFFYMRDHSILSGKSYINVKRYMDIIVSLLGLLLSVPFWIVVPLMIKIESRGDVIYRQDRVGINDSVFSIYKFRTMKCNAEENGVQWAVSGDDRVTGVGKFLRITRIDEIPQLFNVLSGDMSFIGPRPERPYFVRRLEDVIPYYNIRHLIKPGITGWAQVNYPYGSSVEDAERKLEYDLFYMNNASFFLDLRIVLRTIRIVLFGRGI